MRTAVLRWAALGILGCVSCGSSDSPSAGGQAVPVIQKGSQGLIQAAIDASQLNTDREGRINLWNNAPDPAGLLRLQEAFNRRFGIRVEIRRTPLRTVEVANRLVVATQSGRRADGDLAVLTPPTLDALLQRGLLSEFDWVGLLAEEFPAIARRVEPLTGAFKNKALELWHLVYVIAYRTDHVKKEELPERWEDLTDPKWAGRLAVPDAGYPFNYFTSIPGWSEERMLELTRAVKGNQVIFAKGAPGVAVVLQTGEVSLGVTDIANIEYHKDRGAPLDWIVLGGTPVAPKMLTIPEGAPNMHLARLFAAWLTTEGRLMWEDITRKGLAWSEEDSLVSTRLQELGLSDSDLTFIDTAEEAEVSNQFRTRIHQIYLGR